MAGPALCPSDARAFISYARNVRPCHPKMTPPRHIYASSLSRRDRVWGRPRHRLARMLPALTLFTIALLLVVTAAIARAAF